MHHTPIADRYGDYHDKRRFNCQQKIRSPTHAEGMTGSKKRDTEHGTRFFRSRAVALGPWTYYFIDDTFRRVA
jgi:hypothetical protein